MGKENLGLSDFTRFVEKQGFPIYEPSPEETLDEAADTMEAMAKFLAAPVPPTVEEFRRKAREMRERSAKGR